MNHEFSESEMIRQERLAKEYNVSLSPVREALNQLEAEGLLTLVRHHGYANLDHTIRDHGKILEYCASRETNKAAALLQRRIIEAGEDLVGFLKQQRLSK